MLALIDGDIVLYRCCWASQNEPLGIAIARTDEMLDNILVETKADEFQLWLSDNKENNFRFKLDSNYKAKRPLEKPLHFEEIKEYLVVKWGAKFAHGMEADDALGISQTSTFPNNENICSVICSIDKDLKQIPGLHYNFVKKEESFVTPEDGRRAFYTQILVGDTADNIKGCPKIGPVKAGKILGGFSSEWELFNTTRDTYTHAGMSEADLLLAGRLLKIRQVVDEPLWEFPNVVS